MEVKENVLVSILTKDSPIAQHSRVASQIPSRRSRASSSIQRLPNSHLYMPSSRKSPSDFKKPDPIESNDRKKNPVPILKIMEIKTKKPLVFQAEDNFLQSVSQFRASSINQIKKKLNYSTTDKNSVRAFIHLLKDMDPSFKGVNSNLTHESIDNFKAYLSNPGKVIQMIRKIPEFIRNGKLKHTTMRSIRKATEPKLDGFTELKKLIADVLVLYDALRPRRTKRTPLDGLAEPDPRSSARSSSHDFKILHRLPLNLFTEQTDRQSYESKCKAKLLHRFFMNSKRYLNTEENCPSTRMIFTENNDTEINGNCDLFASFDTKDQGERIF